MKISILGTDSTHASIFSKIIISNNKFFDEDISLNKIWGENKNDNEKLTKQLGNDFICDDIEGTLEKCDLALILGRFPKSHYLPAKLAVEKGIPVFVDKPVFETIEEANFILDIVKEKKTFFCGGSALRFSNLVSNLKNSHLKDNSYVFLGPSRCIDMGKDERFNNVNFYGYHLIEVLMELIGDDFISESIKFQSGNYLLDIKTSMGNGTVILFDNVNEFYSISKNNNGNVDFESILLDGSYNSNLLKKIILGIRNNRVPIPHTSILNAIDLLNKMNKIKERIK